jgi:sec-independent protein translocase protein TatA
MFGDIMEPTHLLFVLVVALLVLGPKRLPEVGRTLGSGIRDFRQALSGETHDPPQRPEPEQVSSATTDLRHQPDTATDAEIVWPETAVGPTSFDEPVTAAAAEPAHDSVSETADTTAGRADADSAAHSIHVDTTQSESTSAPNLGATPEEELDFSERELAQQTAESGGSLESQSDSGD